MSNMNIRQESLRNEPARNEQPGKKQANPRDEDDFNKAMKTAGKENNGKSKSDLTDGKAENQPLIDASVLNPEMMVYKTLLSENTGSSPDQAFNGIGLPVSGATLSSPGSLATVDLTSSPMSLEQLTKMMEQITQQTSQAGSQWKFMLLENSNLKQISLQQTAPGHWAILLESSSKSQDQLLSSNLDKLVLRLRANGTNIDMVQMKQAAE